MKMQQDGAQVPAGGGKAAAQVERRGACGLPGALKEVEAAARPACSGTCPGCVRRHAEAAEPVKRRPSA